MLEPTHINSNVSLVDLLPTLVEVAGDERQSILVEPIEGKSLWGYANCEIQTSDSQVYSESTAEGALAPILMVKKKQMKYIRSGIDPEQLFDLDTDPNELDNLIGNPEYAGEYKALSELSK